MIFDDKRDAGRKLAKELEQFKGKKNAIVLALFPEGLPVALEVAKELGLPLDILVARQIKAPHNYQITIGTVMMDGTDRMDNNLIQYIQDVEGVPIMEAYLEASARNQQAIAESMTKKYRGERPYPNLKDKTVILVDEGIIGGSKMEAALEFVNKRQCEEVIIAVPVGPKQKLQELSYENTAVALQVLDSPEAIATYYKHYETLSDEEIQKLLAEAAEAS